MSKVSESLTAEALGFNPEELTQKYRHERDRRIRSDAEAQFLDDSYTPGYYNQEGTTERYRNVRLETYGKGIGAYRKLLAGWQEEGALAGLDLTMTTTGGA